jgi:hypothetical protein
MHDLSKTARRAIRELAGLAYERELAGELTKLRAEFDAWIAGEMTPFELEQVIHQFHDGVSRRLYNRYSSGSPLPHAVAAAVLRGTISVDEIPEPARKPLDRIMALLSEAGQED